MHVDAQPVVVPSPALNFLHFSLSVSSAHMVGLLLCLCVWGTTQRHLQPTSTAAPRFGHYMNA